MIPNRSDPPAFRHLVWTFLTAAFIGERLEVLYVWSATGVVMSRSSLLYGVIAVAVCWLALLANSDVSSFAYFQF